jgi:hypothetical protein
MDGMRAALAILISAGLVSLTAAPAEKKLAIVRTAFAQTEDGSPVPSDYEFLPGETVYFSCQTEGYKKADKDDKTEVYLTYQVEPRDSRGAPLQPLQDGQIKTTVSAEDKDWLPKIREMITVPAFADSGEYQVTVKVKDELGAATTESRARFFVKGRDVAPSDTLIVRNFRFLRTEDDEKPLQLAAYRPGDAVWARFDMTGYRLGDKNLFDIEYGLTVLASDGSVAYSEARAATAKDQSFYPQRYQPGVLSLNLAKDQPLGDYTIVLAVRDNLGQQSYETRQKFSVE